MCVPTGQVHAEGPGAPSELGGQGWPDTDVFLRHRAAQGGWRRGAKTLRMRLRPPWGGDGHAPTLGYSRQLVTNMPIAQPPQ